MGLHAGPVMHMARNARKTCDEFSLICSRATWDTDEEGMWQGQYKGIDDWELREPEDFYGKTAA